MTPVNDAPSFTKGANQTRARGRRRADGRRLGDGDQRRPGERVAARRVDFIVTNTNAALFSAAPAIASNGTLTYTPAANANGSRR